MSPNDYFERIRMLLYYADGCPPLGFTILFNRKKVCTLFFNFWIEQPIPSPQESFCQMNHNILLEIILLFTLTYLFWPKTDKLNYDLEIVRSLFIYLLFIWTHFNILPRLSWTCGHASASCMSVILIQDKSRISLYKKVFWELPTRLWWCKHPCYQA